MMKMSEGMMCSEEDMEVEIVREDQEGYGSMMEVKEEKYSPRMVLKVLLVESDDSTRQIIAALLHKCGYKVAAFSDGKMALEALKVHPRSIDLILTEIELSSISGLDLLTSVMEQDVCRNIPVIMMSSHHSISMAIKCMSKGAADFLIKPVRKNELMNLWQHVWRRHSFTGDNMHLNGPIRQPKVEVTSVNHTANYYLGDYATTTQESKDGYGKKTEAQGHSELQCSRVWGDASLMKNEEHVKLKRDFVGPASEIGEKFYSLGLGITPCNQAYKSTAFRPEDRHTCVEAMPQNESLGPDNNKTAIDFIGAFDSPLMCTDQRSTFKHDIMDVEYAPPHLELSLRRFCPGTSEGVEDTERDMLKLSNASNSSWYSNSQSLKHFFPVLAKSTELKERPSKPNEVLSNPVSQDTACSSQLYDSTQCNHKNIASSVIGQSEKVEQSLKPELRPVPVLGVEYDNFCAERRQLLSSTSCSDAHSSKAACKQALCPSPLSTSVHSNPNIQLSEQSDHRCNEAGDEQSNIELVNERKPGSSFPEQGTCTSSCDFDASHKSRACGVTCKTDDNAATTIENFTPAERLNVLMNPFVNDGLRKMDPYRSSLREAALAKFRLKRKDRCYEKKVRYQSRKRLAEQRPRVKGQFVRRIDSDLAATTNHAPCQ